MDEARDIPPDDEALLAELRRLARLADSPPAHVVELARLAFDWRSVDAELAELVADSALDPTALVRSTEAARLLSFRAGGVELELEVEVEGEARRLYGELAGVPAAALVEVRHPAGTVQVEPDPRGRFEVAGVLPGPVSLCVRTADGTVAVATDWVVL